MVFKHSFKHAFAIQEALIQSLFSAERNGHGDPKILHVSKMEGWVSVLS